MKQVSVVCIRKYGRVLLLRRSKTDPSNPWYWCFPGGGIEQNETPEQAALREIKEESNLKIIEMRKMGEFQDEENNIHLFMTDDVVGRVLLKDGEHDRFAWIHPSEIECYKTFPLCVKTCILIQEQDNQYV